MSFVKTQINGFHKFHCARDKELIGWNLVLTIERINLSIHICVGYVKDTSQSYRQRVYNYRRKRFEHIQALLNMLRNLPIIIDKEFIQRCGLDIQTILDMIMTYHIDKVSKSI